MDHEVAIEVGGDDVVVGDHQQRGSRLARETHHRVEDLLGGDAVEGASWLVGEHDRGLVNESAGNRSPLRLTTGHRAGAVVGDVGDTEPVERLHGGRTGGLPASPEDPQRQQHILDQGELGDEVAELEDHAHPLQT